MQLMSEPDRALRSRRNASAGSINAPPSPSRAISGRQARPPASERFADHRTREPGRARRRFDVERGQQQRPHQPLVERAGEAHHLAHGAVALAPEQTRERQIIDGARAWYAPAPNENPPGDTAVVEPHRPLLAVGEIEEWKFGLGRADQPVLRAQEPQVGSAA